MGRVYAVASGKGGVGKTTTAANLGAALAAAGHDVVVVDADLGMANLAETLGVDPSAATIHDVLAGEADVADATYEGAGGVRVVPGSEDVAAFARSDPEGFDDVLDALSEYDFVVLDTGASLTHVNVRPLAIADAVLLVSTTERAALRDTDRTREVARRVGGTVAGAVLTRVDPENPNAETVDATLDAEVLEVAPEDPAVGEAMAAGEPLAVYAPDSRAAAAYRRLAAHLSDDADAPAESADAVGAGGADADAGASDADAGASDADAGANDANVLGPRGAGTDAAETDAGRRADEPAEGDSEAPTPATAESPAGGPADRDAPGEAGGERTEADDAAPDSTDADASGTDAADASDGTGADAPADDNDADAVAEADAVSETVLAGESGGLVEEAEPGESSPDSGAGEGDDSSSAEGVDGVPDAESDASGGGTDESEGGDEDGDGDGKGFFRRLLG